MVDLAPYRSLGYFDSAVDHDEAEALKSKLPLASLVQAVVQAILALLIDKDP